ncbi:hypothetical protein [Sphingomonas sp.]|uniref:hypothetical protein n=1 Tax=Sphingomonas sp. TaxID=28214 RepID=UPI00333E2319
MEPEKIAESPATIIAYRIPEASRDPGVGRITLYKLISGGELPTVKIGTLGLIRRIDLDNLLGRNLVTARSRPGRPA